MPTKDQIRQLKAARPFSPFIIRLKSGEAFLIRHAESIGWPPVGNMVVAHDHHGPHTFDANHIESLENA